MNTSIRKLAVIATVIAWLPFITMADETPKNPPRDSSAPVPAETDAAGFNQARPNLTGTVHAKDGRPVRATIFIATAGPKVGTSPFCPSCYADCQKSAKADAEGKFEIKSLDPQLRFQVLAVARGFKPEYVNHVDPAKGPITVTLETVEMAAAPPGSCLHGRVMDAKGRPVVGAVVEARGIRTRNGGGLWGSLPGVDPLAVSDETGEFLITSQKPFDQMDVRVSARGLASKTFAELSSGDSLHELTLTEGASVRGRVLFNGQPVTNVMVGMVSMNRDMDHFTGNFDIGTDSDGRFLFVNLPPDVDYYIYGDMDSFEKIGVIPLQTVHAAGDGELTDIGNLVVSPGYRLSGRVVLADGGSIPAETRLLVSRENAWDNVQVNLPPDGRFDLVGVPAETIGLTLRLSGYRVSARNASLDRLNPFQLIGRVDGDVTNLVFLLEKGENLTPDYDSLSAESEQPRNKPLHGAEVGADHFYQMAVSGRVTDQLTGRPLADFKVTPGRADLSWNHNAWDMPNQVEGTNGTFLVYVDRKWPQPVLKAEADGYRPASVMLRALEQTNADFALQPGAGPSGYVVTTNGQPVAKAEVLLVCDDSDQPGFDFEGHLTSWRNKELITQTAADGHFSFAPQLGMTTLVAASSNGFVQVPVTTLTSNSNVVLESYGNIKGVLHRPAGFGTNEDLDLAFVDSDTDFRHRINLSNHAVTDAAGRFEFDRVPAGRLQLSYRLKVGDNGWQNLPLQQVTLAPGQTSDLDIHAAARQAADHFANRPMPKPVRVPGEEINGTILLPDGQPAANAQVAVKMKGIYLSLGRAAFKSYDAWQDGSIVNSGPDGKFTLPMYENAQMVIVVDDAGFAQVPVAELKRSPQITLQPWGRIEGTLRLGHHPAANELVLLTGQQPRISQIRQVKAGGTNAFSVTNTSPEFFEPPAYDYDDFQARTDEKGHFVITYVPPGEQNLVQLVDIGNGARRSQPLGDVVVKPGETTQVSYGGDERAVIGRVTLAGTNAPADFNHATATFQSNSSYEMLKQLRQAGTQAERTALFSSAEFQQAISMARQYSVQLAQDGTFKSPGIPAGKYEVAVDFIDQSLPFTTTTTMAFLSPNQVIVPPAAGTNDDTVVDLGTIALKKLSLAELESNWK
jgi:hypothetical protein